MDGALSRIPGLAGYLGGQATDQALQFGQLRQLGEIQGILTRQQAQEQAQAALLKKQEYLGALSAARTPEERVAIAERFAEPAALLGHSDRKIADATRREMALARIMQTATQGEQMFKLRMQQAQTAADKANVAREYTQWKAGVDRERLKYDTGAEVPAFQLPPTLGALPQEPTAAFGSLPANVPTSDAAAYQAALGGGSGTVNRIMQPAETANMRLMGNEAPAPAPVPFGSLPPEPEAPQPPPAPPSNMDARDRRLAAMGPAATATVAPSVSAAPVPPTFSGSPRQQADALNKWRLQNAKAGTSPAGDFTKRGEEYLRTLEPQDQALVQKVANYEIDPKTLSVLGGRRERVLSMVSQFDPSFDQKNYNTQYNAINRFATGPQGNTVRNLNVAIEHMDTARRMGDALNNGNLQAFNAAAQEYAKQTGSTAPTNFEAVKDILANEVVKGIIGGQSALQDRQEMAAKIKRSSSPQQLNGALDAWTELLGGQLKGLEQQYVGATGRSGDDFRKKYITPRALQAISAVGGGNDIGAQVRSMGIAYEPDKYDYRISNGQVQRKAK